MYSCCYYVGVIGTRHCKFHFTGKDSEISQNQRPNATQLSRKIRSQRLLHCFIQTQQLGEVSYDPIYLYLYCNQCNGVSNSQ